MQIRFGPIIFWLCRSAEASGAMHGGVRWHIATMDWTTVAAMMMAQSDENGGTRESTPYARSTATILLPAGVVTCAWILYWGKRAQIP